MSGVALDILPLLLQQIVIASAAFLAISFVAKTVLHVLRDRARSRPSLVPVIAPRQASVRFWPEKDSTCPRNTGFETRRNPRAPPVLPSQQPDRFQRRPVT